MGDIEKSDGELIDAINGRIVEICHRMILDNTLNHDEIDDMIPSDTDIESLIDDAIHTKMNDNELCAYETFDSFETQQYDVNVDLNARLKALESQPIFSLILIRIKKCLRYTFGFSR